MAGYFNQHFDHEQLTNHDRPLTFQWNVPGLARDLGLCLPHKLEAAASSVLAEAILSAETGRAVSYSRNRNFYAKSHRYRSNSYTYATVLPAIAALNAAGLIIDKRARQGRLGRQSIFIASDKLIDAYDDELIGQLAHDPGEIIRLKDSAGELVDYRDTRETRRMRRDLAQDNEHLAALRIDVPGAERRGRHMVFNNNCFVMPTPGNGLYRIFSRGSFAWHGRAYGWWQNIPEAARATLTINGERVVEADYKSLHPTILYNEAGIRFSGDPYDVDGFKRSDIKLGFVIAINAKNTPAAIAALADHLGTDRRYASNVIAAIKRRHKAIEKQFCSDAGVRLMRTDSELILTVMRTINANGEPALPVHDSLIVPARYEAQTTAKMVEVFTPAEEGQDRRRARSRLSRAEEGTRPLSTLAVSVVPLDASSTPTGTVTPIPPRRSLYPPVMASRSSRRLTTLRLRRLKNAH
jgi:hypothetical protein